MKISIIYHSNSGNTEYVSQIIKEGAEINDSVEVKTMNIDLVDTEFITDSKVIIFGTPTYCGTFSWQIKKWFDEIKSSINLGGKLGAVFATENHIGGGADTALLGLIGMMLCRGMLVYSAGHPAGSPMTHYGPVVIKKGDDYQQERARIFGQRIVEKGLELFGNK